MAGLEDLPSEMAAGIVGTHLSDEEEEECEPQLTADEEVGGRACEEHRAASQRAD